MALATHQSAGAEDPGPLLAQVREAYGRIVYSHKTHEKQADICNEKHRRQRGRKVALTAVSSGAFLASLIGVVLDEQWAALVTSFIAVLISASSLAGKTFQHGEAMQQHRETAAKLWDLRESYLSVIVDLTAGSLTLDAAREARDTLQKAAAAIYKDAPRTTPKAYTRAQDALQLRDDLTFSAAEIDHLLPAALRSRPGGDDVPGK